MNFVVLVGNGPFSLPLPPPPELPPCRRRGNGSPTGGPDVAPNAPAWCPTRPHTILSPGTHASPHRGVPDPTSGRWRGRWRGSAPGLAPANVCLIFDCRENTGLPHPIIRHKTKLFVFLQINFDLLSD